MAVSGTLGLLVLYIIICLFFFLIAVAIMRWAFRINTIVKNQEKVQGLLIELKNILGNPQTKCDCCHRTVPNNFIKKLDSGQLLCNDCIAMMNKT